MMNQQLDKIFREKLEHYHKAPPATAWDRIEAGLEKKTVTKFEWWKIAASLLLLTAVGYAVWNFRSSSKIQPIAQEIIDTDSSKPTDITVPETDQSKISDTSKSETASVKEEKPEANSTPAKVKRRVQTTPPPVATINTQDIQQSVAEEVDISAQPPISTVESDPEPVKKASTITLTISAEEANQYLDKNALAQATSEAKKPSTFKKLLKKASDLKSNQDPFGDLREKKNEILALNFRHEKRGQNK